MKQQLLFLVEWAKYIPVFSQLPLDDQVSSYCQLSIDYLPAIVYSLPDHSTRYHSTASRCVCWITSSWMAHIKSLIINGVDFWRWRSYGHMLRRTSSSAWLVDLCICETFYCWETTRWYRDSRPQWVTVIESWLKAFKWPLEWLELAEQFQSRFHSGQRCSMWSTFCCR